MKRKHNPWVSLAALLLLVTLLVAVCTGCGATKAEAEASDRFTKVEIASVLGGDSRAYILTDNETGAQYLLFRAYNQMAITWLQPAPAEKGE